MIVKVCLLACSLALVMGKASPEGPEIVGHDPAHTHTIELQPKPVYHADFDDGHVEETHVPAPLHYGFGWIVKDAYNGNDFGHRQQTDGYDTKGSYYVLLPDGRRQTVTYYVNGDSGFVADVTYDGEAVYPLLKEATPLKSSGSYSSGSIEAFEPSIEVFPHPLRRFQFPVHRYQPFPFRIRPFFVGNRLPTSHNHLTSHAPTVSSHAPSSYAPSISNHDSSVSSHAPTVSSHAPSFTSHASSDSSHAPHSGQRSDENILSHDLDEFQPRTYNLAQPRVFDTQDISYFPRSSYQGLNA